MNLAAREWVSLKKNCKSKFLYTYAINLQFESHCYYILNNENFDTMCGTD